MTYMNNPRNHNKRWTEQEDEVLEKHIEDYELAASLLDRSIQACESRARRLDLMPYHPFGYDKITNRWAPKKFKSYIHDFKEINITYGWLCPKCHTVIAPFLTYCIRCNDEDGWGYGRT